MNNIFVSSESPDGSHQCVVEGDERSVWAYLHSKEKKEILSDVPVCSLTPLLTVKEFKEKYSGDGAPPLVEGYFLQDCVYPKLENERIEIEWSTEGLDVLVDQQVVSRIEFGKKRGFSSFLTQDCPWGSPLKT
ncbi:hypothetical protein [Cerasicoccus maritimus]|uniref:hypothetical protein n=1 Tax=Cerasicoccus maritimus TaxID=490089 RepID=UPI002852A9ED|nr:hypothetical protein [Cerasicoccus maritimus]